MKRPEVKIPIPDILKMKLVDDWENVTKNNQVGVWSVYIAYAPALLSIRSLLIARGHLHSSSLFPKHPPSRKSSKSINNTPRANERKKS